MFSRREVVLAAVASGVASAQNGTHGFVLVHGAWHGAWCWDAVLKKLGTNAVAPTLTGLAERARELKPDINMSTHVMDVVGACANFDRITLVGHSYGGLVITAAFDSLSEKIERLVYLDAFVPANGQTGFDLMKKEYGQHWREKSKNGAVPPMLSAKAMGIDDVKLAKTVDAKLTPHPLATFESKVQFDEANWKRTKKTYIRCARYAGFGPTAQRAKTLGFDVHEIDAGHDAMLSAPDALSARLLKG
ncbi:MAG: alpha/beta fold hydrolase [Archangium sp.]